MDDEPTQPPPPWLGRGAEPLPPWPDVAGGPSPWSPPPPPRQRRRGRVGLALAWLAVLVAPLVAVVIGLVLAVRGRRRRQGLALIAAGVAMTVAVGLTMTTYRMPGTTMSPTLEAGDQVLATRIGSSARGDVVAFHPPASQGTEGLYLKRIVAVGGETVGAAGGRLYVCRGGARPADPGRPGATRGCAVPREPYLKGGATADFGPTSVPPGHVFLLDDNRRPALDSRLFGPVPRRSIVARVLFEYRGRHVGPV
jgi:signal peptidase I